MPRLQSCTPPWYTKRMSQIAVRLTDSELRELDSMVAAGGFRTRAEAVREGIGLLRRETRERRIAASYLRAYESQPLNEDEQQMLDAAAALTDEMPP
jgi:Arc/MetJ-type ribon-helix-helix transcriptional regulator